MDKNEAIDICLLGNEYLINKIKNDGSFVYLTDYNGNEVGNKYNLIRHCGAVWAIQRVSDELNIDLSNVNGDPISYVISNLKVYNDKKLLLNCKGWYHLGAQALSSFILDGKYKDGVINGIDSFFDDKGNIVRYKWNDLNPNTDYICDYYAGETALALIEYGNIEQAENLVIWIWEKRDKNAVKQIQDCWLLQALYLLMNGSNDVVKQKFYLNYGLKIYKSIIIDTYYMDKCCPMACRIEGLVAYYKMSGDIEVFDFIEYLIQKLKHFQIIDENLITFGGFQDDSVFRIDYTQHSICGILEYCKL